MATAAPTIEELEQRRAELATRSQEIDAEHAGQEFPPDVRAEFQAILDESEALDKTIDELRSRKEWISKLAGDPDAREDEQSSIRQFQTSRPGVVKGEDIYDLSSVRSSVSGPEEAASQLNDRAKRSVEMARFPNPDADREDNQGHIERLLGRHETGGELARYLLATGSPAYKRAFGKALAGQPHTDEERVALSLVAPGSSGGYAVPYTLDPTVLLTSNSNVNPIRAIARKETLTGSNTWNGVSSTGVTAVRIAEATEAADGSPTLAQPTATVTKAQVFIPYSIEVSQDWTGMQGELSRMIQEAKDTEESTSFTTGVGTTVYPQGVATGTTNTVAAATGLTITAANVYALENALPPRYRPNETFMANRAIYNIIRGIDTAGGAALWVRIGDGFQNQVPTPGNIGQTLLNAPAYEASAMQATVVNATKILIIGDFSRYLVLDRIGMTVEVVPHLFGSANNYPTGERGLYAYWRNTGKVLDANAFRALTGTT